MTQDSEYEISLDEIEREFLEDLAASNGFKSVEEYNDSYFDSLIEQERMHE